MRFRTSFPRASFPRFFVPPFFVPPFLVPPFLVAAEGYGLRRIELIGVMFLSIHQPPPGR